MKELEHELYVEIYQKHISGATGLDRGRDPLCVALTEYDPESVWVLDLAGEVVCRYLTDQETVYRIDEDLKLFLMAWSDWWVANALMDLKDRREYPRLPDGECLNFLMGHEEYPDEYLVPGYFKMAR